ncbi:MAG: hypothetical protein J6112_07110 [Clostridia bacterium]|nr:hypothetical protein [Clostridia bacterium]
MPEKKNQPAPIILADYQENENHLVNVRDAQHTLEDQLWFGFEYRSKNDIMRNAEGDFQPEEAVKYGFNPECAVNQDDEQIQGGLRSTYRDMVKAYSIEDYKKYFSALGSMKAKTAVISGRHYESIEKALDENTPNRDEKAFYLYRSSGLTARSNACNDFCLDCQEDAERSLGEALEKKYDYKTVTMRQFAQDMGIDIEKLNLPEGAADKTVYDLRRPDFPKADENTMKEQVFQMLQANFGEYFVRQGVDAAVEKMTEGQKNLYRKALEVGGRGENADLSKIEEWIQDEGEALAADLRTASAISNMKDARYRTQLSGTFGSNDEGFLDKEIKKETARTRFISDIVGKKKDIGQVKESIVSKANRDFYAESLRKYPAETPAKASYENYVTLHTGIKGGSTPDEMVENLSKALSASALQELDRKFNLKEARQIGQHFKELFALDTLKMKPELLKSALQDGSSVLRMGRQLRKTFYGVAPEKQQSFSAKMRTLQSHLMPPEKRSKEYQKFYKAVKTCAELEEKMEGMTAEEKEKAYCQANLDVFEAARTYMDGKESVRSRDTGKLSFDHALDALAICSETTPALNVRTDKILGNINRVRNQNNPQAANYIDAESFHERYGAAHSDRSVADYSRRNRNVNIVHDPAEEIKGPANV